MPHERIIRDPDSVRKPRQFYCLDDEYESIKLAAKELKMPIGQAMCFLSQTYLEELDCI